MNEWKIPGFPKGLGARQGLLDIWKTLSLLGLVQKPHTLNTTARLGVCGFGCACRLWPSSRACSYCSVQAVGTNPWPETGILWEREAIRREACEIGNSPFGYRETLEPSRECFLVGSKDLRARTFITILERKGTALPEMCRPTLDCGGCGKVIA